MLSLPRAQVQSNMPQLHNVRGKKVDGYWNFLDFKLRAILSPFLFHVGFFFFFVFIIFSPISLNVLLICDSGVL